ADGKDCGDEPGVGRDRAVHLVDRGGELGPRVLDVGVAVDPSGPQGVVADEEPSGADPVAGGTPRAGVSVLVDVAIHDVERALRLAEGGDRLTDMELDRAG